MNNYFSEFVKQNGGDDSFSNSVGVTRQTIGNIKRGRNKATEKLSKKLKNYILTLIEHCILVLKGQIIILIRLKLLKKRMMN